MNPKPSRDLILILLSLPLLASANTQSRLGDNAYVDINTRAVCTLSNDNSLQCDTTPDSVTILPAEELKNNVAKVTLGAAHACAIQLDGTVSCWGQNDFGQLDVPTNASPAIDIDAGETHTCAITDSGKAVCWGLDSNDRTTPPETSASYLDISAGLKHSCAVTIEGGVECWGAEDALVNQIPEDLPPVSSVVAGFDQTCVLTTAGDIRCWQIWGNFFAIPDNGPYTDISSAGGGNGTIICGLDSAGNADCAVSPPDVIFDPTIDRLSQQKAEAAQRARNIEQAARDLGPFQQISTASIYRDTIREPNFFDFDVFGCGVKFDGTLACWETPVLVDLSTNAGGPNFAPGLTVSIYSATSIELFWQTQVDFYVGEGLGAYEILRDSEVFALITNRGSYFDDSLTADTTYMYQIRAVSASGIRGPLSEPLSVNTVEREGSNAGEPGDGYQPPSRPLQPSNLEALIYGSTILELIWDRPTSPAKGYEIRVNGDYVAFTSGTSYLLEDLDTDTLHHMQVIAIDADNNIAGVSVVSAELGDPYQCF